jgi:hypothetical protein
MKRIVLLRFHKNIKIVQNRIDLLHHYSPGISIYGLFGGLREDFPQFRDTLTGIEHVHYLDIDTYDIKWRFSDYSILTWFMEYGKTLDFDILHTAEYDLVFLDSLENIYPYKPGEKHVYITNLVKTKDIMHESNWFVNPEFPVAECLALSKLLEEKYHIPLDEQLNSKAPGLTVTREFLVGYEKLVSELPLIGYDEMRTPAIARILSIEMRDTGFVKDWFDETSLDFRLFNTDNVAVDQKDMWDAVKNSGRRAFHPVYGVVSTE